jgi:hypothetical protein
VFPYIYSTDLEALLGRALDFSQEIDDFVGRHRDLRALELDPSDWAAISQVAGWLKAFRSATTEMSKTKEPMLSTIHAIFRGLQDHVSSILRELPDSAPTQLRTGLVDAHTKLSEYYFRLDESPYYTWAACEYAFSMELRADHFFQCLTLALCMKGLSRIVFQTLRYSLTWTSRSSSSNFITRNIMLNCRDQPIYFPPGVCLRSHRRAAVFADHQRR